MPLNKADLIPPLFHGQVVGGGNNERGGLGWGVRYCRTSVMRGRM